MKRISASAVILAVALPLAFGGCESFISFAVRSSRDWAFVQSVGGIAIGAPRRAGAHLELPIRCDVSGLQTVTTRPTALNSILVCEPPTVRICNDNVFLTIRTTLATSGDHSSLCPNANLDRIGAGRYSVFYLSPDGSRHYLGTFHK